MSPFFWGAQMWTNHCRYALVKVVQRRRLTLVPWSHGNIFASATWLLLAASKGHFAGSCSTRCSPGPLLESGFPAKHHPACTGEYLGFLPPQGQDLAFPFAWIQKSLAGQDLQPSDMPRNDSTTQWYIWCTNNSSCFFHTCRSEECLPYPIIQVITEDVTQLLAPLSTSVVKIQNNIF